MAALAGSIPASVTERFFPEKTSVFSFSGRKPPVVMGQRLIGLRNCAWMAAGFRTILPPPN
ncbi:MAG: hypothetical protein IJS19_05625 [Muribaculaceae bacterium]|nr:hypothetical protein [Muribaculaceae bacterium]